VREENNLPIAWEDDKESAVTSQAALKNRNIRESDYA